MLCYHMTCTDWGKTVSNSFGSQIIIRTVEASPSQVKKALYWHVCELQMIMRAMTGGITIIHALDDDWMVLLTCFSSTHVHNIM